MLMINGKAVKLDKKLSVADYLAENNYKLTHIAVELNEEILSKDKYAEKMLKDGDCLEILNFVGGG